MDMCRYGRVYIRVGVSVSIKLSLDARYESHQQMIQRLRALEQRFPDIAKVSLVPRILNLSLVTYISPKYPISLQSIQYFSLISYISP